MPLAGPPHATLWRPPADARRVALSPAGSCVAVLHRTDAATIHDLDGRVLHHIEVPPDLRLLAVSDDGGLLAAVDGSRRLHMRARAPGAPLQTLALPCGDHRTYRVQAGPTRTELRVAAHHLRFAPDGRALLIAAYDLDDQEDYYGGGSVTTRATLLLVDCPSGHVQTLLDDAATRPITYRASDTERDAEAIHAAAFSPAGGWIALLRPRAGLALRAAAASGEARPFGPPRAGLDAFAFAPGDARLLIAAGARVTIHDLADARERGAFDAPAPLRALAARGDRIAALAPSGDTFVLTADGALLARLPPAHDAPARDLCWVGERLVLACDDGALVIWS